MTPRPGWELDRLPADLRQQVDAACDRFEGDWRAGARPRLEDHLCDPARPEYAALLFELIGLDLDLRRECGDRPTPDEYRPRFPGHDALVRAAFADAGASTLVRESEPARPDGPDSHRPAPDRFGPYVVAGRLGAGACGVVYRCRHEATGDEVAVKVPRDPAAADAIEAEADRLKELDHPAILRFVAHGRAADDTFYLASEYIDGRSLAQHLAGGRRPPAEAAGITAAVAEALHHAHRRGLFHRDVKPSNVLLRADGRPVLADFGLALREREYGTEPEFAGTVPYMSPEQAARRGRQVGERSDVYSLGVVFYELLTGQLPFRGTDRRPGELVRQIEAELPRSPGVLVDGLDPELSRVCLKCLAKRPADRYATAGDLAADLRAWLGRGVAPPRRWADRFRPTRRHVLRALGAGAALGGAAAVAGVVGERAADWLVERAVAAPVEDLPGLLPEIESCRFWTDPKLAAVCRSANRPVDQQLAAYLLLPAGDGRPPLSPAARERLVERLFNGGDREVGVLYDLGLGGADAETRTDLVGRLTEALDRHLPGNNPEGTDRAVLALLRLDADAGWDQFRHRADRHQKPGQRWLLPVLCPPGLPRFGVGPDLRTHLIHAAGRSNIPVELILKRLEGEKSASARRALILVLGGLDPGSVGPHRQSVAARLREWYRSDTDPGVHSAIDWLLRRWGDDADLRTADRELAGRLYAARLNPTGPVWQGGGFDWSVTRDGEFTLADVKHWYKDFPSGSPANEPYREPDEGPVTLRIERMFAVATKEVTVSQFGRFLDERPGVARAFPLPAAADRDAPVVGVPLPLAAAYCNWLSERDGLDVSEFCFCEPTRDRAGLAAAGRHYLDRMGYRLPTAAEWEYACRAGEVASRFYGTRDDLLGEYAWYDRNAGGRPHPVGLRKPNDLGLFDLYGNAAEWCLSPTFPPPPDRPRSDPPVPFVLEAITPGQEWVVRGGSFASPAGRLRSAAWDRREVTAAGPTVGFRVARTTVRSKSI